MQTTYNNFMFHSFRYVFGPLLNLMQLSFHIAFSSSDSSDCNFMMRFSANSCPQVPKLCQNHRKLLKLLELIYQASTQPICSVYWVYHALKTPEQHIPHYSVANLPGNAELSSLPVPAAREDGALHPVFGQSEASAWKAEQRNEQSGMPLLCVQHEELV